MKFKKILKIPVISIRIIKHYGLIALFKACWNKIQKRPLLAGISSRKDLFISSKTNFNKIGNQIFYKQQSEYTIDEFCNRIELMKRHPHISIVIPLYNPDLSFLKIAIDSVIKQCYPYWELILVDDGSKNKRHLKCIEEYALQDSRISVIRNNMNKGISYATNCGIQKAKYDFIALMDQDDQITRDCLFWFAREIENNNKIDFIYSDECKIGKNNRLFDFYFKPDWSPFLLYSHMYTSHMSVYKKALIDKVGGLRSRFDFSQDYDLALRASSEAEKIVHIERVLYFWRSTKNSGAGGGKGFARKTNIAALKDFFNSQNLQMKVTKERWKNGFKSIIPHNSLVSIIIPSDNIKNIKTTIKGIFKNTSYKRIEIIIVARSDVISKTEIKNKIIKYIKYDGPFNFSKKCNIGANASTGKYLLFMNDDVVPKRRDWLDRLLDIAIIKNVGSVSPLCLFPNNLIQYAGMDSCHTNIIFTPFIGHKYEMYENSIFNHFLTRNVLVMSGACSLVNKDAFCKVGGFDEINTPNGHSDVVLSFKLIKAGYNCVYNPDSIVTHLGSATWSKKNTADKSDLYLFEKYPDYINKDPFFTKSQFICYYLSDDFFSLYNRFDHNIFCPPQQIRQKTKNDILFITHDLSLTGAPYVMLKFIKQALNNNTKVYVYSFKDGPLRFDLQKLGIPIMIDPDAVHHPELYFYKFARNFDKVFANTIVTAKCVECLQNDLPKIIWWIHEGSIIINEWKTLVPKQINFNQTDIYAVSEYSKRKMSEVFPNFKISVLNFGINKSVRHTAIKSKPPFNILFVGEFEKRKGIDILLKSVSMLSNETKDKIHFEIIGDTINDVKSYTIIKKNPELFSHSNRLPHKEFTKKILNADLLIVPSRDDPLPIVIIEMMQLGKPFFASTNVGISDYLNNQLKDLLIFENGNSKELAKKLQCFINNPKKYLLVREKLIKLYNAKFSEKVFNEKVKQILAGLID